MRCAAGRGILLSAVLLLVSAAAGAQGDSDLNINSPSVVTIRKSIAERFNVLREHFQAGAIGLTQDGLIALRDAGALQLDARKRVESLVNDDNNDRDTLYREIARLNGRPDWESSLHRTFGERWISRAPSGWYYREPGGQWVRKK